VKLIAAGTEHLAADGIGAGVYFEEGVSAIFVVLDGKALEKSVAGGAGGGSKGWSHGFIIANLRMIVKRNFANTFLRMLG
jgi:hypothetical protein